MLQDWLYSTQNISTAILSVHERRYADGALEYTVDVACVTRVIGVTATIEVSTHGMGDLECSLQVRDCELDIWVGFLGLVLGMEDVEVAVLLASAPPVNLIHLCLVPSFLQPLVLRHSH